MLDECPSTEPYSQIHDQFPAFWHKGEKGINLNNRLLEREPMDTF